jgi:hypothetical protein
MPFTQSAIRTGVTAVAPMTFCRRVLAGPMERARKGGMGVDSTRKGVRMGQVYRLSRSGQPAENLLAFDHVPFLRSSHEPTIALYAPG